MDGAKATHTEGPWTAKPLPEGGLEIWSRQGAIGYVYGRDEPYEPNANAHLFAAGPTLLAVLVKARAYIEMDAKNQKYPLAIEIVANIDAAVATATTLDEA